jgi:hypothetical protein
MRIRRGRDEMSEEEEKKREEGKKDQEVNQPGRCRAIHGKV